MANYGIKVSKKGYDVKTATLENLILSSAKNCLKVKSLATTTIQTDINGDGTKFVPHGLSFRPVVIAFIEAEPNIWYPMPCIPIEGLATYYVTTTNIVFYVTLFNPNSTYNVAYFVSETESAS